MNKKVRGRPRFMLLEIFNDPSDGYLVDESCAFGAKVLLSRVRVLANGRYLMMRVFHIHTNERYPVSQLWLKRAALKYSLSAM